MKTKVKAEKKSIVELVNMIDKKKLYLPAIQRKYVWDDEQIYGLMDSLMRGYPISTFLFWEVKKKDINENHYRMYEFIQKYDERTPENPLGPDPFPVSDENTTIFAVLDGQQRLTTLTIALLGSMRRKIKNKWSSNADAYPEKELYFNINKDYENTNENYEFKFLKKEEALKTDNDEIWYKVKDIIQFEKMAQIQKKYSDEKASWVNNTVAVDNVNKLFEEFVMSQEKINYFLVETDSMDEVLDIFVRVNSGGEVLSKSDLLFSTIVSQWPEAREKVEELLKDINKRGEGYNFDNDFIMRASLFLLGLTFKLKVSSFGQNQVDEVKKSWNSIEEALKDTVDLLEELGFNKENITSNNAILPIVYYRYITKKAFSKYDSKVKQDVKKYFVLSQLKHIFGASSDTVLSMIRAEIEKTRSKVTEFNLDTMYNIHFSGIGSIKCTAQEIEEMVDKLEKDKYTYLILTLLYPDLKYKGTKFHQDHMHPHTSFEEKKISSLVMSDGSLISRDKMEDWKFKRNTLANLQILPGPENTEKNKTPYKDWLNDPSHPERKEQAKYLPAGVSLELSNFDEFYEKRKALILERLKTILL